MTIKDNPEVSWSDKILRECIGEEPPPCQAACPLNIRVREKLRLMQQGNLTEALAVVLERCPFPGILGRICTHPCEAACTRNSLDQPIAVAGLKRYLADLAPDAVLNVAPGPDRPQPVAVVGGGPAGLMAAYELRRFGYPVTLFEAEPFLGGALRLYIPPYRLPREVLEREVSVVQKLGAEVRLRTRLGRDVHLEDLRRDFAAVFLALGAHKGLSLQIPGENLTGVMDGISFLKAVNAGAPPAVGRRVAVIGGGNAAVDAARSAWRAGAQEVHLLYRRTADLMPALASEVEEARREGVQFHCLTLPVRLLGDGRVRGLVAQKTELGEPAASGRSCPMPVPGSEFTLEVDTVIPAVGQTADFSFFGPGLAFDTATIFRLEADPVTLATQIPGVFAGGDLVTGPQSAVEAFAAGRRAALAIHASLAGEPLPQELPTLTSRGTNLIVDTSGAEITSRQPMPDLSLAARTNQPDAEVELGFTDAAAQAEAARCISCACSQCVKHCTFLQHYVPEFPGTEKGLVRLLGERGLADPLIPYSCHYCGLCQAVCPVDLHAGRPCLSAREALVAGGKGPLPPHKGIQNYVKWGASPTFALSRPDPATGKAARVFFPGCSLAGHATDGGAGGLRPPAPEAAGYGHHAQLLRRPQLFHGGERRHAPDHRQRGRGTGAAGGARGHRGLHPLLPDLSGISPGGQNPHDLRGAERGGSAGGDPHRAALDLQHPGPLRRPPGPPDSRRGAPPGRRPGARQWRRWPTTGSAASAAAPAAWCPRWPRRLAKKMTDFRLSEATRDLVTYCASCRARLAKAGHPTLHVLDLPFNPAWQQTKTQPPPHSLLRWWRRWRLKRYLGGL